MVKQAQIKKPKTYLVQTRISKDAYVHLTKLAQATSRSNAGYLRALINTHVKAVDPRIAVALSRAWKDLKEKDVLEEETPE